MRWVKKEIREKKRQIEIDRVKKNKRKKEGERKRERERELERDREIERYWRDIAC